MAAPPKRRQPKSEQLRRDLIRAIKDGVYKPGDMLPTVRELGEQYQISHVVASVALNQLVEVGYVVKRQGQGTFVAENAGGDPVALRLHSIYPLNTALVSAINRFSEAHPTLKVEMCKAREDADVLVFGTSGVWGGYKGSYLLPLDDRMADANLAPHDFVPFPMQVATIAGTAYALPYMTSLDMLFYRPEALSNKQLGQISYWSLEELLEAVGSITAKWPETRSPLNRGRGFSSQIMCFLRPFGARLVDEERSQSLLDSPEIRDVFDFDTKLGAAMPHTTPGKQCSVSHLTGGHLAMLLGGGCLYEHVLDNKEIAVAPAPYGNRHEARITGEWIGISSFSQQPDAAWKLLRFLTSAKEQRMMSKAKVVFPGRRDAFDELLKSSKGLFDVPGRNMLISNQPIDRISTEDLFFIDQILGDWRSAPDLTALLASATKLLDARLFDVNCDAHVEAADPGLV